MPLANGWDLLHLNNQEPQQIADKPAPPFNMSLLFSASPPIRKRIIFFVIVFAFAGVIRWLTYNFVRDHLYDAAWFQYGSYRVFDKSAQNILDGRARIFWIDDATRTDQVQYPPAYPWFVALVYRLTGNRSAYAVQKVQAMMDVVLCLLLATGIAVTVYGWRVAMIASILVALSPLLAIVGVWPSADAPTTWFVLSALWLLLIAVKRNSAWFAIASGVGLGVACWLRVNPLYLCLFWALPVLIVATAPWRRRVLMSAVMVLATVSVISPIVVRNYLVFPDFTPTGGTIGVNLWEGLGETELGRSAGFMYGDDKMIERERMQMGLPADFPLEAMWPDGIKRERERTRESLAFIRQHPVWYAGVMLQRMWGMLKVAGHPSPYYGTSGINVTGPKCLPVNWQGGFVAAIVYVLGAVQSIARYLLIPLAAIGVWLSWRKNSQLTLLLLATIFYYLVPGTFAHTEIRYVQPVHALLPIFAAVAAVSLWRVCKLRLSKEA
jgi:4-amino-4-deoxy-L-arabinose transferase-like glycosyltransferase